MSYRDIEELLAERGVEVDHVTIYRWVQRFTPLLADAARLGALQTEVGARLRNRVEGASVCDRMGGRTLAGLVAVALCAVAGCASVAAPAAYDREMDFDRFTATPLLQHKQVVPGVGLSLYHSPPSSNVGSVRSGAQCSSGTHVLHTVRNGCLWALRSGAPLLSEGQ